MMLDANLLREFIHYDPTTGAFIWKVRSREFFRNDNQWKNWNSRYPETQAGHITKKGYRHIGINGRIYRSCRLAWLYHSGQWPLHHIDHINGDRLDDRIENLRDVTNVENCRNRRLEGHSMSGRVGVTPYNVNNRTARWVARIRIDKKLLHLGYFDTIEEAAAARLTAERAHGFTTYPKPVARLQGRGFPTRKVNK